MRVPLHMKHEDRFTRRGAYELLAHWSQAIAANPAGFRQTKGTGSKRLRPHKTQGKNAATGLDMYLTGLQFTAHYAAT